MSEVFSSNPEAYRPAAKDYAEMEAKSAQSWYMTEATRPFEVFTSTHSAGKEIDPDHPLDFLAMKDVTTRAVRRILGGNVSIAPQLGPQAIGHEAKVLDASNNTRAILETIGVAPGAVHILNGLQSGHDRPDALKPLNIDAYDLAHGVDIDASMPIRLEDRSDFLYSYNPNISLAATPADCPILFATGETPQGPIEILVHFSWRGVANDYVARAAERFEELKVTPSSRRIFLTAGAHGEHFPFTNPDDPRAAFPKNAELFHAVHKEGDEYSYGIDTPLYVYNQVIEHIAHGDAWKVFGDVTDTADTKVGRSSHNFNFNFDPQNNTRDIVVMKPAKMEPLPEKFIPPEILKNITTVPVKYRDFHGESHQGRIEVHTNVAGDVAAFFEAAYQMDFPLFHVGRSKDYHYDDDILMDRNISSGFNYRPIKGTGRLSLHSQGLAFDVNPRINPFIRYTEEGIEANPAGAYYDPSKPGALYGKHPLVELMKERGWEWGGDWKPESGRTDYQHFQKPPQ